MKEIKIKGRMSNDWACDRWMYFISKHEGLDLSLKKKSTIINKLKLTLGDKIEVIIRKV